MLDSQVKIDLVHVCTPPYVHCEIAVNSMKIDTVQNKLPEVRVSYFSGHLKMLL